MADLLLCSESSVYNWVSAWRRWGLDGLREPPRVGRRPLLDAPGEQLLADLLRVEPDARDDGAQPWTAARLQQELRRAGYDVDDRTVRRVLHRLGWRWKGTAYVMTRLGTSRPR